MDWCLGEGVSGPEPSMSTPGMGPGGRTGVHRRRGLYCSTKGEDTIEIHDPKVLGMIHEFVKLNKPYLNPVGFVGFTFQI